MIETRSFFISSDDKTKIADLGRSLYEHQIEVLVLPGDTAKTLEKANVPTTLLTEFLGNDEITKLVEAEPDGVAGRDLLSQAAAKRLNRPRAELLANGIQPIDGICVNLKPPTYDPETKSAVPDRGMNYIFAAMAGARIILNTNAHIESYLHSLNLAIDPFSSALVEPWVNTKYIIEYMQSLSEDIESTDPKLIQ